MIFLIWRNLDYHPIGICFLKALSESLIWDLPNDIASTEMEEINMNAVEQLLITTQKEVGYLEKKSNKDLDSKTANAGSNNYTKYARDLYPSLQGQAWCDMFVDWCFVQTFGQVSTRQLIGGFSAYTPTSAQSYKNQGRYHKTNPQPGDQIFFRNSSRICHTGIVKKVTANLVYTIEGNTGSGASVIANGGGVWEKSYPLSYSQIDGYGRPDWSLVEVPKYKPGWHQDPNGWWYADTARSYLNSCWKNINGHRYYFNQEGYALTGWQVIDGKKYFFEAIVGHPLECALYATDGDGAQEIGEFH